MSDQTVIQEKKLTRSEQKRLDILEAARRCFMEQGFDSTSVDQIAEQASVSKRTVYSHFGSKEELFATLMNDACMESVSLICPEQQKEDLDFEETMVAVAASFITMIASPEKVSMMRVLVAEGPKNPGMANEFFKNGPNFFIDGMTTFLVRAAEEGLLELRGSPRDNATNFVAGLHHDNHIRCLIMGEETPSPERIQELAENAVHRFLYGVGSKKLKRKQHWKRHQGQCRFSDWFHGKMSAQKD